MWSHSTAHDGALVVEVVALAELVPGVARALMLDDRAADAPTLVEVQL